MPATTQQLCDLLPWDSEFFGFTVARLRADILTPETRPHIDQWCRDNKVACLYFPARADDPKTSRLAEEHGFHLVDVRVTYGREIIPEETQRPIPSSACHGHLDRASLRSNLPDTNITNPSSESQPPHPIRPAAPADLESLKRIARLSHTDTRFYNDRNFPNHLCEAFYERWIQASCQGYADQVLVADLSGAVAGYVACHIDPDTATGSIGLIAVDASAQNRGLGRSLVDAALAWMASRNARRARVVTQARNVPAQRLYQRLGFLLEEVALFYHKWYRYGENDAPVADPL